MLDEHTAPTTGLTGGGLAARGAVAGLSAGLLFILANMWVALAAGKPPVAPFLAISTVFTAAPAPDPGPQAVVIGVVLHLALSVLFGLGFAALVAAVPRLGAPGPLLLAGLGYGLALWVVNFEILGHTLFPFFTNPAGPNLIVELIVHPLLFGLPTAAFFLGARRT